MAITFENIYKERVLDNIEKIIKGSLPSISLSYDEHRGVESFLIIPVSDAEIEILSNSHIREFTTQISYEFRSGGEYSKNRQGNRLTDIAEILKRLIYNNSNYNVSDVNQWYDGGVSSVEYERDEDDPEVSRSIITFNCKVNEVIG